MIFLQRVILDWVLQAGRGTGLVGCASTWHAGCRGFDPHVRQHFFVETFYGHSFPTADSVTCERMFT